jgi:thioredoxin reductase
MHMKHIDVAVIGGSAAGLSAALVLTRAGREVVVIDSKAPRNAPAAHMHGFLSRDGMSPADLLTVGRMEVEGYGGTITNGRVMDLAPDDGQGFWVLLEDGTSVGARKVLIATGLRDELPPVPGLRERWARDVLHCPYCHGHEVAGRRLGVVGGARGAVRYAHIVRQWTPDLVYFTPPDTLTAEERTGLVARAIGIVESTIDQLVIDEDRLVGVQMADGGVVPRDALFVPPHFVPNDELLIRVGCEIGDDGWVVVDGAGGTSVAGIWAAGNVTDPRAQVVTAAGAGSAAAIAINADLVDDDVRMAVEAFNLGHTA